MSPSIWKALGVFWMSGMLADASGAASAAGPAPSPGAANSKIKRLVVIVQENHTFDNYFGQYCKAPTGSNPTCNVGQECCEAGPAQLGNVKPVVLDDAENGRVDRNHYQNCELDEINGGKMDRFVTGSTIPDCSSPANFGYSPPALVAPYLEWAKKYALADRYFQPAVGQTSMNDMFLSSARFVFLDNSFTPKAIGKLCGGENPPLKDFPEPTIADLLNEKKVTWAFYAGGYAAAKAADKKGPPYDPCKALGCPVSEASCPESKKKQDNRYPCTYDPTDNPFNYYPSLGHDNPVNFRDFDTQFVADVGETLATSKLPTVTWIKAIGYKTEHPDSGIKISAGVDFVTGVVAAINANSELAASTLILFTYDEGGGFYDHVPPPKTYKGEASGGYGTRVPMLAIGPFARQNFVSHVVMEHSSLVKFIEWNWLGGVTGQLHARDAQVNNIGSLLDPALGVPN